MSPRSRFRRLAWLGAALLTGASARAQTGPDTNVIIPNVMLLVDSSGSMEWKSASATSPACVPDSINTGAPTDQNEKSRWIELTEVLTGTIQNYSCYSQPRNTTAFSTEFAITSGSSTYQPLDYGYIDTYHRPLSNKCAPGPGDLPSSTTPWAWPTTPIKYRQYASGAVSPTTYCATGTFAQANDGLLDSFFGRLRFGLMTFDTQVDPGTGVTSANTTYGVIGGNADYKNGIQGAWSYYLPAGTGCLHKASSGACKTLFADGSTTAPDGCCVGGPRDCLTLTPYEVGARNAAAPPWEGRMVPFGVSTSNGTDSNGKIQNVILATRPYGTTPIAGLLHDAQDFFWYDDTKDPANPGEGIGPISDPLVANKCRDNYIVLLTDGEPNLDLRTACEGSPDNCPFDKPEEITRQLMNPSDSTKPKVRTFVVGFALGTVTVGGVTRACSSLTTTETACAAPTDPAVRVCCTLNKIAYNGTPAADQVSTDPDVIKTALYPNGATDLRTALSKVFSAALKNSYATRTYPVVANAPAAETAGRVGYQFLSGYTVNSSSIRNQWRGVLDRQRLECGGSATTGQAQSVSETAGDDFIANVNSDPTKRKIFTVAAPSSASWNAARSVRPYVSGTTVDGAGNTTGVPTPYLAPSDVKSYVTEKMLNVTASSCGSPLPATDAACAARLSDWYAGVINASPVTRCETADSVKCNVIGDIYRSVPQIVPGVPAEALRDPTYTAFSTAFKTRDTALYTASNDGFFHGFLVFPGSDISARQVTSKKPNELFAFVPPAVLRSVVSMYPTGTATDLNTQINRIPALDGAPVIKDVAATQNGSRALNTSTSSTLYYPYRLERKKFADATETHTWRTVSVQSFGTQRTGYYALDVTSPTIVTGDATSGPRFLWQLTTNDSDRPLFGAGGSTPLITTLYLDLSTVDPTSTENTREVAVAVLPGGFGDGTTSGTGCGVTTSITVQQNTKGPGPTGTFNRTGNCYNNSDANIAARSVTIVRLDTGQILRTFRPTLPGSVTAPVTFPSNVLTTVEIPAPITGAPAAYPSQAGTVADRIFVGDAEGRLYRLDVSSTNPANWTMKVFFDAYYDKTTTNYQPVETAPILSVDDRGQLTIAYSTGKQENIIENTLTNYVTSLTEYIATPSAGTRDFYSYLNWRYVLSSGERVLGPMTLFDRNLYFSTYTPTSSSCSTVDTTKVYGMDYVTAATDASLNTVGGKQVADPVSGALLSSAKYDGVVSGVPIRQLPSCRSGSVAPTSSTDQYLGFGSTTTMTTTTPGDVQLVFARSGGASAGSGAPTTKIPTQNLGLPVARTALRIDSWAPIIE